MKLNKKCMVCGEELWVMNDEVEFFTDKYMLGHRICVSQETIHCICKTCGTEYTISGEHDLVKKLKDSVGV